MPGTPRPSNACYSVQQDAPGAEAAAKAEKPAPAQEEDEDIEWEEAGAPADAASGGLFLPLLASSQGCYMLCS